MKGSDMVADQKANKSEKKKDVMKPFSMKMTGEDEEKLELIRKHLNLDSASATIRKLIRDYKI